LQQRFSSHYSPLS